MDLKEDLERNVMVETINSIFKIIDGKVKEIVENYPIDEGNQFEELSKLYWDSWNHLKNKMGTSAGWPWFGEYIVFYAVKYHIENKTGVDFENKLKRGFGSVKVYTAELDDKSLVLGHNAILKLKDRSSVRPDIFFLVNNEQLIFTIDVKVSITSKWTMASSKGGALIKLARTMEDSRWKRTPLGYLICLDKDMSTPAQMCNRYQEKGVKIVGPRGGLIEKKLKSSDFPMTTFQGCIREILEAFK